jgi:outer membrane biosynthesis protein TonB
MEDDIDLEGFDANMFDNIELPANPNLEIPAEYRNILYGSISGHKPMQAAQQSIAEPKTVVQPQPSRNLPPQIQPASNHQHPPPPKPLNAAQFQIAPQPKPQALPSPLPPRKHAHSRSPSDQIDDNQSIHSNSSKMFGINISSSPSNDQDSQSAITTETGHSFKRTTLLPVVDSYLANVNEEETTICTSCGHQEDRRRVGFSG